MQTRSSFLGALLCVVSLTGCKDGLQETPCETLCRRGGEAHAGCAPDDCVETCETPLPQCDGAYRVYVECLAGAELLGCMNESEPTALGECDGPQSELVSCLLGSATGSDDDDGGDGGEDTGNGETGGDSTTGDDDGDGHGQAGDTEDEVEPCDPLHASCVGCGIESCDAPQECCWDATPTCGDVGACSVSVTSSCDGAEDCPGAQCCVAMLVSGADATVSYGEAACSPAAGSVCCSGTVGMPGCPAEPTVESCVCALDEYCCSVEWDAQCGAQVQEFGCGTCAAGCEFGNASTGSGSSIKSIACRTNADCAGVVGNFGVPYGTCCMGVGFDVGACVSQTYAAEIAGAGGACG
jgi:hypothetical protein